MKDRAVLDASALLALLNQEPGGEVVEDALPGALISAVNFSEVVAKLVDKGVPETGARAVLEDIGLEIYPFDTEQAFRTGELRPKTRPLGLSLGDRACLALGDLLDLPVLTTDRSWKELKLGIEVRMIR
jgi:PIN domain nuclease of toxin-antitoxin system